MGGRPFPDGEEPDSHSHGAADEEFASVVFDEDFIRSARVHEPTAAERMLAAAQARAEAEAKSSPVGGKAEEELYDNVLGPDGSPDPDHEDAGEYDRDAGDYGLFRRRGATRRPYLGHARWHRPMAWMLALVMGIGMVALAFSAVYRGAAGSRQEPAPPPATSGVDGGEATQFTERPGTLPSAPADSTAPTVPAVPHRG